MQHHYATHHYCLVYVDDIIITGNDNTVISNATWSLQDQFLVKTLGDLNYILFIKVKRIKEGLCLTQYKYI